MPITIRKIELFVLSCFSLQHLSNVPKMPVFLSFFPKNRHFEMGSNCDVLTLKRTSFSTFFVVGRSNHLPTTSAFFRQIPSVAIYTKKLEINLTAMSRGFESHRLRQEQCLAGCCFLFCSKLCKGCKVGFEQPVPGALRPAGLQQSCGLLQGRGRIPPPAPSITTQFHIG